MNVPDFEVPNYREELARAERERAAAPLPPAPGPVGFPRPNWIAEELARRSDPPPPPAPPRFVGEAVDWDRELSQRAANELRATQPEPPEDQEPRPARPKRRWRT